MIQTRHLFSIKLSVPSIIDLGQTPMGGRKIAQVSGGEFTGDRMKGTVVQAPGGDWLLMRPDQVLTLDVRLTLLTDDGDYIYMSYRGLRHGPQEVMDKLNKGEPVDPALYYFRMTPIFETSSAKYAWLNRIIGVGTGRRESTGPIYEVYEVL
jgi:hypothetical protein